MTDELFGNFNMTSAANSTSTDKIDIPKMLELIRSIKPIKRQLFVGTKSYFDKLRSYIEPQPDLPKENLGFWQTLSHLYGIECMWFDTRSEMWEWLLYHRDSYKDYHILFLDENFDVKTD